MVKTVSTARENNKIQTQLVVALETQPADYDSQHVVEGKLFSDEAGLVIHGHYSMDYLLPGGDKLRILANHNHHLPQVLLISHDAEKLRRMPGIRKFSLTSEVIQRVHGYILRSANYPRPLSDEQAAKLRYAKDCIKALEKLLAREREIDCRNFSAQEALRQEIISILQDYQHQNHLLANHPSVSEGGLGTIFYEALQAAQYYSFNSLAQVSLWDQLDFREHQGRPGAMKRPCFVWDSSLHVSSSKEIELAVQEIILQYGLNSISADQEPPANRVERFFHFWQKFWEDGVDWVNYQTLESKPEHHVEKQLKTDDSLKITEVHPYYLLDGPKQMAFDSIAAMASAYTKSQHSYEERDNYKAAYQYVSGLSEGGWCDIPNENRLLLKLNNRTVILPYFKQEEQYYVKPNGSDLLNLCKLSEKHLYFFERFRLQLSSFITRIPAFFVKFYKLLKQYITIDLYQDLHQYIHGDHDKQLLDHNNALEENRLRPKSTHFIDFLNNQGVLQNGKTLQEFIKEHLDHENQIYVRPEHQYATMHYDNPLHRTVNIALELGHLFLDPIEKDPLIGSLSMAAYFYGGGAILAPEALRALLIKLHLNGLIIGIEPTQAVGKFMSHGTGSEAVSAAVAYWQAVIVGGDIDQFLTKAVALVKDNPAEVAIIMALAMGLGYGICEGIPAFSKEMGSFPYINYMAAGAKGSAAVYDTVMHPGDDWLLGTCKWLLRCFLACYKIFIAPMVEAYHYGYEKGFKNGLRKSAKLLVLSFWQLSVGVLDLMLIIISIPLRELSIAFFHIPLRGISALLSKTLGALGRLQAMGEKLLYFSKQLLNVEFLRHFRLSPLYGFSSPLKTYADNRLANFAANALMCIIWPTLQILKNFLLLPVTDLLVFVTFFSLEFLAKPLLFVTLGLSGGLLYSTGFLWDNSVGILCRGLATGISWVSHWIDKGVCTGRQWLLSKIHVARQTLYHSAFDLPEETQTPSDEELLTQRPSNFFRLPGQHLLLELIHQSVQPMEEKDETHVHEYFSPIFSANPKSNEKKANSLCENQSNQQIFEN